MASYHTIHYETEKLKNAENAETLNFIFDPPDHISVNAPNNLFINYLIHYIASGVVTSGTTINSCPVLHQVHEKVIKRTPADENSL